MTGGMAYVYDRSVVAAEDANFCAHWGFDMVEIRKVIASGSSRGASTLTQQTAKNVFLWQGRSWPRKLLETAYTPMIEALWSKRRIVEVYLNLAEFGPGVFGVAAAAKHHFGTTPDKLSARQAAALASILPAPERPQAARPARAAPAPSPTGPRPSRRTGATPACACPAVPRAFPAPRPAPKPVETRPPERVSTLQARA
jgi:monofunctional biosynthetic peptidoglycan transglycosylase